MPCHCRSSISLQRWKVLRTGVAQSLVEINSGLVEKWMEPLKRNAADAGWALLTLKIKRYTEHKWPAESGMQPAATGRERYKVTPTSLRRLKYRISEEVKRAARGGSQHLRLHGYSVVRPPFPSKNISHLPACPQP
jgi:hypothetical protein